MRWLGGLALVLTLAVILVGLWRGLRRPAGTHSGTAPGALRSPAYLLLTSLLYFGACTCLWRPLSLALPVVARWVALVLGALLLFSGIALVLWGRVTLGRLYGVTSSFGAQLYADHQLVRSGPYGYLRHPMYAGLLLLGLGGLLLYRTWTFVFVTVTFLSLVGRARREERVLAAQFGEAWEAYRRQVPAWFPRLGGNERAGG